MNILVISATEKEISPSITFLKERDIDFVVTGVGMTATAFSLGLNLQKKKYDLLVNIGIAGSFFESVKVGDVVNVVQDRFIELGAENKADFISLEDLGFGSSVFFNYAPDHIQKFINLPIVNGITVNTVHGNKASIEQLKRRISPMTVESMEGAATFYAAKQTNTPIIQVRSISNFVETRDTTRWNIPLAIKNLNLWLQSFLTNI